MGSSVVEDHSSVETLNVELERYRLLALVASLDPPKALGFVLTSRYKSVDVGKQRVEFHCPSLRHVLLFQSLFGDAEVKSIDTGQ